MKVYFDKSNFISFSLNIDKEMGGRDALRMLKNQLDIHFNFKYSDLAEEEKILFEEFTSGVSRDARITQGLDEIKRGPLNTESFPSKCGIYLLDDDQIQKFKLENSYLVGEVGEEIETLTKLIINSDYQFHKQLEIGSKITFENFIDLLSLPFSTIFVIDRYLFKGPAIGGNLGLLECNFDKFIRNIFINKESPSTLVFIYQINTLVSRTNPIYDEGPDPEALTKRFRAFAMRKCPRPTVIFIGVQSGVIDDEHDRYIISDYLNIKSGDSFIFFSSTGKKKTASSTVDYYSLANREYRRTKNVLLAKIKGMAKESLEKYPQYSKWPVGLELNAIFT
jgi:hypothetical protein